MNVCAEFKLILVEESFDGLSSHSQATFNEVEKYLQKIEREIGQGKIDILAE